MKANTYTDTIKVFVTIILVILIVINMIEIVSAGGGEFHRYQSISELELPDVQAHKNYVNAQVEELGKKGYSIGDGNLRIVCPDGCEGVARGTTPQTSSGKALHSYIEYELYDPSSKTYKWVRDDIQSARTSALHDTKTGTTTTQIREVQAVDHGIAKTRTGVTPIPTQVTDGSLIEIETGKYTFQNGKLNGWDATFASEGTYVGYNENEIIKSHLTILAWGA